MNTILDYLKKANTDYPDRIAYVSETEELTFSQVYHSAMQIGSMLASHIKPGQPVAVMAKRDVWVPVMYLGVVCAGCYYAPFNIHQPAERINIMLNLIKPAVILTDGSCDALIASLEYTGKVLSIKKMPDGNEAANTNPTPHIIDTDPLYVLFTSGSTGIPKGIAVPHRSVIDYLLTFIDTFSLNENDILGAQADFGFDVSLGDIYIPLILGTKTVIIQPEMFSLNKPLFEYINSHKITALCWVTSALSVVCSFNLFDFGTLTTVKKVFAAGAALPAKHLRIWQQNLPDVTFINHYGPTEITVTCTYHIFDHIVEDDEDIPIGIPYRNRDVFLLSDDNKAAPQGEQGEICVRGSCLAIGYFGDFDKTNEVFVSNPLRPDFPERIYKTGDYGIFRPDGVLLYRGRKDRQIKHMGYRIELGEIEAAALTIESVHTCACLYKNDEIILYYQGDAGKKELAVHLREALPGYMIPRKLLQLDEFPMSSAGKIDMPALKARKD